jgi:PAS domain S-box-containing protein
MSISVKAGNERITAGDPIKGVGALVKTRIRLRLMIAIPVITTLLVLGLGWIIIDMCSRELISGTPPETVDLFLTRARMTVDHVAIAVVLWSVLSLVAGLVLAYTITYPIRRLTSDTASIAKGDLSRTIHLGGEGEIAMLGSAFNDMVSSINKYLLQTMSGGVVTINEKAVITSMSADAEVILGVSAQELVGRGITEMIPDTKENRRFHQVIRDTLESRRTHVGREMTVTTENRDAIPISISTSFLRDRDDTLIGLIVSFEDVKHLKKIQEQMRIVDRLTTLGGLAAGIAHQVRNPLCSIRGLAQLLKESAAENSSLSDYSDVILSDVDRIDKVIDRLLRFIQPNATGWTFASLNDVVEDTLLLARHEIRKKDIDFEADYASELPKILCQRENLMQAILNLFVNAFQSIENSGKVWVRTLHVEDPGGSPFGAVRLEIGDDGPGMTKEIISRIFEPSFTTKDDGGGFGLAITRQTVEVHGGRITVKSTPNVKTTFTILLPIRKQEVQEGEPVGHAESV